MSQAPEIAAMLRRVADAIEDDGTDSESVVIIAGISIGNGAEGAVFGIGMGRRMNVMQTYAALGAADVGKKQIVDFLTAQLGAQEPPHD